MGKTVTGIIDKDGHNTDKDSCRGKNFDKGDSRGSASLNTSIRSVKIAKSKLKTKTHAIE